MSFIRVIGGIDMKITQKLEWDYEENKITSTDFMTRDTIKDVVAAELFILIVEELYDKNIFTNWSGLTGNAHIRIPLDGLSKENFLIAKQNCEKQSESLEITKTTI